MTALLPALMQLKGFLDRAINHAAALHRAGVQWNVTTLTLYLEDEMRAWNPKASGQFLIDDVTRQAAARFIAGVVTNLHAKNK